MKIKLLALAAAFASCTALAAQSDTWSIGVGAGWQHSFDGDSGTARGVSDKNGLGLKLNGEYNFTDWLGLGVGYNYLRGTKADYGFYHSSRTAHIAEAYGRLALPLDNFGSDVFVKAGPTYTRSYAFGNSDGNFGAVAGVGAQWALSGSSSLRAGYDYYFNTHKEGIDVDDGLLYVGYQYSFR